MKRQRAPRRPDNATKKQKQKKKLFGMNVRINVIPPFKLKTCESEAVNVNSGFSVNIICSINASSHMLCGRSLNVSVGFIKLVC